MNWNYSNPSVSGNYICDFRGDGIRLSWWNGKNWVEMWGSEILEPAGWIEVPYHLDRNDVAHKLEKQTI